jgi:hydroxyacylglutathione hydrolase
MEKFNIEGTPFERSTLTPCPVSAKEFQRRVAAGAQVVDTRSPLAFAGAHIMGSYSIPRSVLSYAGWFINYDHPILLVTDTLDDLDYVVRSLFRIGYDTVEGYLRNGLRAWYGNGYPLSAFDLLTVHELKAWLDAGEELTILDVRSLAEWEDGRIESAQHIYLGYLEQRIAEVPRDLPVVSVCGIGLRASIGASILQKHGFERVYNLIGGMSAWRQSDYPTTQ